MRFSLVSVAILAVLAVSAVAQNGVGSFRGRIVDADTGRPFIEEGVTIVITKSGESAATRRVIDVRGEFVVPDLSPGRYQLQFRYKGIQTGTQRFFQVTGPASATPADIYLWIPGEITGEVVDRDGQPVQGARVQLVTSEYLAGQNVYTVFTGSGPTDDRGHYSIASRLETGQPYFLLVTPPAGTRPTLSGTPSLEAVWYPGRPGFSQPFIVRSAERKRLDFVLEKTKTYCVGGTLTKNGQPATLGFEIAIPEVAGYRGTTGGTRGVISRGQSDESGHFEACGLWPGKFRVAAGMNQTGGGGTQTLFVANSYGRTTVSIVDRDVEDVKLNVQSAVTLAAEIRVDGEETRPPTKYRLSFTPLSRVAFESQPFLANGLNVVVPSRFTVSLLPATDYGVNLGRLDGSSNWYLKDVTCGGITSRSSLKLSDTDCGLRITVGTDAGQLTATILDKDNKNDPNSSVCVASASSVTREDISLTGSCSPVDPGTTSASVTLRPDRYFAVAMPAGTRDWVEYFLTHRGQGTPFEIKPRSAVPLTLKRIPGF